MVIFKKWVVLTWEYLVCNLLGVGLDALQKMLVCPVPDKVSFCCSIGPGAGRANVNFQEDPIWKGNGAGAPLTLSTLVFREFLNWMMVFQA